MKDFNRPNLLFSLCGLNCALCPMQIDGYCPGCGGGEGNQSCAIAKCSLSHDKAEYCFLCAAYPCEKYEGAEEYDSFITYRRQMGDMTRAQEIGMEAYNAEQIKKAKILQMLLSGYNDGRRKTFYCLALNLLPTDGLETVMEQLMRNGLAGRTVKEKAGNAVSLLIQLADGLGIDLRLRKK